MPTPKILTIDIETAPLTAFVWGLFDQNVGLNQIKGEWAILSYAAKWLHSDQLYYDDTFKQRNKLDDKRILKALWKMLDEADIVIGQNVERFDVRKINARFMLNGMPPPSPYRIIDTMKAARRTFAFTSNKLEWLSEYLSDVKKGKHKKYPGFELWSAFMNGEADAQAEMKEYNLIDVVATEKVYLKLRPWMPDHPNIATYNEVNDGPTCRVCGSHHVVKRGTRNTQIGVYHRFHCQACGAWSRGRTMINTKEQRGTLLAN